MKPRRFSWDSDTGTHEMDLVWVPETTVTPYAFGHGSERKPIQLRGFFIATTPVTQALWTRVMGENPAFHVDPRCPVENVSWEHITEPGGFLDRINASDVLTSVAADDHDLRFRLPTEAEWEYAARGGPHWRDDFAFSGSHDADRVAWCGPRWGAADEALVRLFGWPVGWRLTNRIRKLVPRRTTTQPVATKAPNQLSIFDMSGNVWEWCEDVCTDDLAALPSDGGPHLGRGTDRRLRGGCYNNWDLHCRVWWRYGIQQDAHDGCIGFRLVLSSQSHASR
jgi:formylglycine-generating enzyme required for sulfatase activity